MRASRRLALAAGLCAALIVAGLLVCGEARRRADYEAALRLEASGETASAYALLTGLGGYRDASARRDALVAREPGLPWLSAGKGDVLPLGRWEQDGDGDDGVEPIEWIVLDRVDGRLLLLSLYGLESRAYNPVPFEPVTWETCALRAWLNGAFLDEAFTEAERAMIPAVWNANADHPEAGTPGGGDTRDRAFLLSENDARIYLDSREARELTGSATPTSAAKDEGLWTDGEGRCAWWLRSPGAYPYAAQFIDETGSLYPGGAYVELETTCAVRPAIWLDAGKGAGA